MHALLIIRSKRESVPQSEDCEAHTYICYEGFIESRGHIDVSRNLEENIDSFADQSDHSKRLSPANQMAQNAFYQPIKTLKTPFASQSERSKRLSPANQDASERPRRLII